MCSGTKEPTSECNDLVQRLEDSRAVREVHHHACSAVGVVQVLIARFGSIRYQPRQLGLLGPCGRYRDRRLFFESLSLLTIIK